MSDKHPLPPWFTALRASQEVAIDEIIDAFNRVDVVFLNGPTGTGKTLIAQRVAARMDVAATYVCSDKGLQDQFLRDFPYSRVLKGRANYPTELGTKDKTAEDCTSTGNGPCWFCSSKARCPYQIAKRQAIGSHMAVLNTAYFLTEANFVGNFGGKNRRALVIADEADELESSLTNFIEFRVPSYIFKQGLLKMPIKSARKTTLVKWLDEVIVVAGDLKHQAERDENPKRANAMGQLAADCRFVQTELRREIEAGRDDTDDEQQMGMWLRDYDVQEKSGAFCLKPVMVAGYGNRYLWRHGGKWLVMSASIISAEEMAQSLGLTMEYEVIDVPMSFPVENRPIVLAPIANVVYKEMDRARPALVTAIERIIERHPDERVLVHCVSFHLAKHLCYNVSAPGRKKVIYQDGKDKKRALQEFLDTRGAVIYAASMERGVDLADDACRVQVIAKVPFPALGDRQVSARTRAEGGQLWYVVQAIRAMVQMTGRAVRSDEDWAMTYVLDAQFTKNLWAKWRELFPGWWKEAVDKGQDIRWMMK